ncbi:hypothetical protein CLF_112217, partial [Clonorchis sinensis]
MSPSLIPLKWIVSGTQGQNRPAPEQSRQPQQDRSYRGVEAQQDRSYRGVEESENPPLGTDTFFDAEHKAC